MKTVNIDLFLGKWYWRTSASIITDFGLAGISNATKVRLTNYHNIENGILFAQTRGANLKKVINCFVVGGPCISDCEESITFEAAVEIINTLQISKILGQPAILFIGTQEEILKNSAGKQEWIRVAANIERFVHNISKVIKNDNYYVIKTHEEKVKSVLDKFSNKLAVKKNLDDLNGLYDIQKKKPRSIVDNLDYHPAKDMHYINSRNVLTYCPEIISCLINVKPMPAVVVENAQQLKAVEKAKEIRKKLFKKSVKDIIHLAHCPVPGISGSQRMYRSTKPNKLYLGSAKKELKKTVDSLSDGVALYWYSVLPPELTCNGADLREKLLNAIFLLRKCFLT